jgi:PHD/YefM family antitoxin component YafN of YafNO toxin-antitoxin module
MSYNTISLSYDTCYGATMIETEFRDAATLRVPALEEGRALVVTRYDEEKAVVMNPLDFRRLAALDATLEAIREVDAPAMTPLVLEAHRLEDEADEPVEDPGAIRGLLGL